jgi:DNA-binding MarR family transcriptional regulator
MHQIRCILVDVDGLELFNLGRRLMKIGEEAIHQAGFHPLPTSVRSIMVDAFEHPDSSVTEITSRTGFPQSHVSASVARLRDAGVLVTAIDPQDRRRTLVRPSPEIRERAERMAAPQVDAVLAAALGAADAGQVAEIVGRLEELARLLGTHRRPPAGP